jgi:hypothetical protein
MSRTNSIRALSAAIIGLAAVWAGWFFATSRNFSDPAPLPQGAVTAPSISVEMSRSQLRVFVRVGLETLTRIVNQMLPDSIDVDQGGARGKVSRSPLTLTSAGKSRLEVEGSATFKGKKSLGPFAITKAEVSIDGSKLGLHIDPEWKCRITPDVKAKLTDIDVTLAPDWLVQQVVNLFIKSYVPSLLEDKTEFSVKPLAEEAWRRANRNVKVRANPIEGVILLRPDQAVVSDPRIDDVSNDMRVCLGIDFSSVLFIGQQEPGDAAPATKPLPQLEATRPAPTVSRVVMPIVIPVAELSRFWQPQEIAVAGGRFRIDAVEFSEKDGLLHGRMRFAFQPGNGISPLLGRVVNGVVRFQLRPSCDSRIGQVGVSDFKFTERSDSLLVDMLGANANAAIRDGFELLVPPVADAALRRVEMELKAEVNDVLKEAVARWAKEVPQLHDELAKAKPSISGISLKPTEVTAKDGHLVLIIEAEGNAAVELD